MSAQHDNLHRLVQHAKALALGGVPMWWHPHALAHVSRESQNANHAQQPQATTSINKESQ